MRILIVDDNSDVQDLLKMALARKGVPVDVADSVRTALRWLTTVRYDGIILDQDLPDGSGLKIVELLDLQGTPVILYTAGDLTTQLKKHAACLGIRAIYSKQISAEDLLELIGPEFRLP